MHISSLPLTWSICTIDTNFSGQMQWYACRDTLIDLVTMCCFYVRHIWVIVICQPFSEVHGSMILYSFLLGSHRSHCTLFYIGGSLDPMGVTRSYRTHWPGGQWRQWVLGYRDRGSINPRIVWLTRFVGHWNVLSSLSNIILVTLSAA